MDILTAMVQINLINRMQAPMKLITATMIVDLIRDIGVSEFYKELTIMLENDFRNWNKFNKSPRHAVHFPEGVIELMPCSDDTYYSFKYVNGHPGNTEQGKLSVFALGMLSDVRTGYPLILSEMTLLTAFRTAATSAIASKYMARKNSSAVSIIGTGSQSEFQIMALKNIFRIHKVKCFDRDKNAMLKFKKNLAGEFENIEICSTAEEAVAGSDIIITATADKKHARLFDPSSVREGTHINAVGGDCPGKTELDLNLLKRSRVVVEYLEQTRLEGEIQLNEIPQVHGELWEIISGIKPGRENENEITIFDSVGFALEDFSTLKLIYQMMEKRGQGEAVDLIPEPDDPKNLYGLISGGKNSPDAFN